MKGKNMTVLVVLLLSLFAVGTLFEIENRYLRSFEVGSMVQNHSQFSQAQSIDKRISKDIIEDEWHVKLPEKEYSATWSFPLMGPLKWLPPAGKCVIVNTDKDDRIISAEIGYP